jgi:hypothetical protein
MEYLKNEDVVIGNFFEALQKKDKQAFVHLLTPDIHFTHNGIPECIYQWADTFFFCNEPAKFVSIDKNDDGIVLAKLLVDGGQLLHVKLSFTIVYGRVSILDAGRQ